MDAAEQPAGEFGNPRRPGMKPIVGLLSAVALGVLGFVLELEVGHAAAWLPVLVALAVAIGFAVSQRRLGDRWRRIQAELDRVRSEIQLERYEALRDVQAEKVSQKQQLAESASKYQEEAIERLRRTVEELAANLEAAAAKATSAGRDAVSAAATEALEAIAQQSDDRARRLAGLAEEVTRSHDEHRIALRSEGERQQRVLEEKAESHAMALAAVFAERRDRASAELAETASKYQEGAIERLRRTVEELAANLEAAAAQATSAGRDAVSAAATGALEAITQRSDDQARRLAGLAEEVARSQDEHRIALRSEGERQQGVLEEKAESHAVALAAVFAERRDRAGAQLSESASKYQEGAIERLRRTAEDLAANLEAAAATAAGAGRDAVSAAATGALEAIAQQSDDQARSQDEHRVALRSESDAAIDVASGRLAAAATEALAALESARSSVLAEIRQAGATQASSAAAEAAIAAETVGEAELEDAGALANRFADLQAAWGRTTADLCAQAEAQAGRLAEGTRAVAAQCDESLSRLTAAAEELSARIAAEAGSASQTVRGELEAARATLQKEVALVNREQGSFAEPVAQPAPGATLRDAQAIALSLLRAAYFLLVQISQLQTPVTALATRRTLAELNRLLALVIPEAGERNLFVRRLMTEVRQLGASGVELMQ